jgi:hypothetical protein
MGSRMSWPQIRMSDEYRGRWVALDNCRYDARTAQPVEGTIIDADEDLVELCTRIRQSDNKHCAILFCDETAVDEVSPPSSERRRPSYPPPPQLMSDPSDRLVSDASDRPDPSGNDPDRPQTH